MSRHGLGSRGGSTSNHALRPSPFDASYVDEKYVSIYCVLCANLTLYIRHMQQFEEALRADDATFMGDLSEVPNSPVVGPRHLTPPPPGQRVRKVSALSDFAPVNLKVKRYGLIIHSLLSRMPKTRLDANGRRDRPTRAASGSTFSYDGRYWYAGS